MKLEHKNLYLYKQKHIGNEKSNRIHRKRLEQLEDEVHTEFSNLLKQKPIFKLTKEEDLDNGEVDEIFEVRNDMTGEVFDIHIMYVKQTGAMLIVDVEDYGVFKTVTFSDLASVRDKIDLVELLKEKL